MSDKPIDNETAVQELEIVVALNPDSGTPGAITVKAECWCFRVSPGGDLMLFADAEEYPEWPGMVWARGTWFMVRTISSGAEGDK